MSARNLYHDAVVHALTADGWTITDDPLWLRYGDQDLYVDLGAERKTLGAEKAGRRIAVEVQSFLGRSPVRDLQQALGQYEIYRIILGESDPDRQLYMAVTDLVHDSVLSDRFGRLIVSRCNLRLLVFDDEHREDLPMDRTDEYRLILRRVIEDYAAGKPSYGQIETEAIVDHEKDHFEVVHVGWDNKSRRVHGIVVHVDIINGKVWIQYDGTDRPVADELLAAGIPPEDIVLGFQPAKLRHLTGFAVE